MLYFEVELELEGALTSTPGMYFGPTRHKLCGGNSPALRRFFHDSAGPKDARTLRFFAGFQKTDGNCHFPRRFPSISLRQNSVFAPDGPRSMPPPSAPRAASGPRSKRSGHRSRSGSRSMGNLPRSISWESQVKVS